VTKGALGRIGTGTGALDRRFGSVRSATGCERDGASIVRARERGFEERERERKWERRVEERERGG